MSLLSSLTKLTARSAKRVGRGVGSGKGGHTAGRGTKGQRSRTGSTAPLWFEGGQLPLTKRLPMQRGKGRFKVVRPAAEVTLSELNNMQAETITLDTLKLEKVIDRRFAKAKVINTGTVTKKITLEGVVATAGARQAIEAAGGTVSA